MHSLARSCFVIMTALVLTPATMCAQESHYMILFAHETRPGPITNAHTYVTFVKGSAAERKANAVHTISWLPAGGDVRLLRRPQAGVNLTLEETLQRARACGARVVAWGPYPISKELYDRSVTQFDRLNSGAVAYKALDHRFRPECATNCIHAISDMVDGPLLNTGLACGVPATAMVRRHLSPWIVPGKARPSWVIEALNLNKQAIDYVD